MIDAGVVVASAGDLVRLVAVPVLAWAAWRDVRTRRVPGELWRPLVVLAVVLLGVDGWTAMTADPAAQSRFLVQASLSLGFVVPLAYLFWRVAGFGGADAKAVMVLALLFPTYPEYLTTAAPQSLGVPGVLPVVNTTVPVFSFTVLTNAVVVGALYPVGLVVWNAARGDVSSIMFLARPVAVERLPRTHGRLLERADGTVGRGLDLDALRMYLRWRGHDLGQLRADPDRYRNPESVPDTPNPPGDGVVTDDGPRGERTEATDDRPDGTDGESTDTRTAGGRQAAVSEEDETDDHVDPWGAEAFLSDVEGHAYGTQPEDLRDGLDLLTTADRVWVSPGLPFMVPLFLGVLVGLTYGDLLFGALAAAGAV